MNRITRLLKSLNCDGLFGLALLTGCAMLLLPVLAGDAGREALRYDRTALAAGQWWRLLTAHFVHLDFDHAALNSLGLLLRALGKPYQAETEHRTAIDLQQKLAAEFPSDPQYRAELAMSYTNLGNLFAAGKRADAEPALRTALDINERLATQLLGKQMVTSVFLVKALGGGWDDSQIQHEGVRPALSQAVQQ